MVLVSGVTETVRAVTGSRRAGLGRPAHTAVETRHHVVNVSNLSTFLVASSPALVKHCCPVSAKTQVNFMIHI